MSLETATQTGVDNEADKQVAENPRNSYMQEIAEKNRQERDRELKAAGQAVVDTLTDPNPDDPEEPEQKEPEEKPEPEAKEVKPEEKPEPEQQQEPEEELVTIKVGGELQQVPKSKAIEAGIRALQKESFADKRLDEATRLLREIEQKYNKPKDETPPPPEWDEATIAYALEHGDEAAKAEAVRQIRGRRDTATPEQIVASTTAQVLEHVNSKSAADWFASEYQDVVSDPYLFQLADMRDFQMRESGDNRPRREILKDIGDELRKWKGGIAVPQSLEQKREQKASITNTPAASARKQAPEAPKPKTASSIIEEMRKARHQA